MVAGSSWFCLAPENSYQKDVSRFVRGSNGHFLLQNVTN